MKVQGRYDVALVGSGLASTFTTIRLIERLLEIEPPAVTRLVVFEKSGEFYSGVAYGRRSGRTSLILTSLGEFLPPAELSAFITWLADNVDWCLDDLRTAGGARSAEWLAQFERAIRAGTCADLQVPRRLWGLYLSQWIERLVNDATAAGLLDYSLVQAEITEIRPSPSGYEIIGRDQLVETHTVVLGLGASPTRTLIGGSEVGALLIEDPYHPDLGHTLAQITDRTSGAGEQLNILVVGGNAGSMEVLYQLSDVAGIHDVGATIHVLAPQGRLPERHNEKVTPQFVPAHLLGLKDQEVIASEEILETVKLDLADARAAGLDVSHSLPPISAGVLELLGRLSREELEAFVAHAGKEIGRLQRRAGPCECAAAADLAAAGRLHVVAGRYVAIAPNDDTTAIVSYVAPTGERHDLAQPMSVVVNCSGSAGLELPNQSALIESLLTNGLCEVTPSGHGFKVNDRFEARPNLFVNGPLLAGNVVNGTGIWHTESARGIIDFSGILAGHLVSTLGLAETTLDPANHGNGPAWAAHRSSMTP